MVACTNLLGSLALLLLLLAIADADLLILGIGLGQFWVRKVVGVRSAHM